MRAEIISIGTEILLGELLDTNSNYLARRLPALGLDLYFISQAGDNLQRLSDTIRHALDRSDILLLTGGLGPTEDDVTREAIAAVLGEEMYLDPEAEQRLRAFFEARGAPFPERGVKQANLIASARAIPNPRGTAPGWWVERDGHIIVAMPGPPAELERMWEEEVAPELARLAPAGIIFSRTLKTIGIGESRVDEMIAPLLSSANPTVGIYAKVDGVHLRLTAKAGTMETARALIEPLEAEARASLTDGKAALAGGRVVEAMALFDAGMRAVARAIALTSPGIPWDAQAASHAFVERRRHAVSYLAAIERADDLSTAVGADVADLRARLGEADRQFAGGDLKPARATLDRVYRDIVGLVSEIRRGHMVVVSRVFETPRGEFEYERRRNQSYELLVQIALAERGGGQPGLAGLAARLTAESEALRDQAEREGASGDFAAAIGTMERATERLLVVLRASGLIMME